MASQRMTVDEFLAWEARQDPKYELVDGRPVMMTGGTADHGDLRGAIYVHLRQALQGRPCRAHLDLKIVCGNGNVRYPDVQVDCGPTRGKDVQAAGPVVVVEVVSPSSRATDYILKVRDYASVPSISTYLIVSQNERQVTVLRRSDDRLDLAEILDSTGDVVDLPEVGISLPMTAIYASDDPTDRL